MIRAGKIRYIGVSNYAAWQLAKALGISERLGLEKFCVYQGYYNIAARELEHEIIPLSVDQNVGITVWSPLAGASSPVNTLAIRRFLRAVGWRTPPRLSRRRSPIANKPGRLWK